MCIWMGLSMCVCTGRIPHQPTNHINRSPNATGRIRRGQGGGGGPRESHLCRVRQAVGWEGAEGGRYWGLCLFVGIHPPIVDLYRDRFDRPSPPPTHPHTHQQAAPASAATDDASAPVLQQQPSTQPQAPPVLGRTITGGSSGGGGSSLGSGGGAAPMEGVTGGAARG